MTDLIFHIGLAKCGSSTLQREVFSHEDGYLGTAPNITPEKNLAKQLQHCTPFAGRQTIDRGGLADWAARVKRTQEKNWPGIARLIASNEVLSGASWFSARPILRVLFMLNTKVWRDGQIKVVLVLGNQAARLASSYAQTSSRRPNAGQKDFELFVEHALANRRKKRLFDYSGLINGLEAVVGPQNTCVLLLEDSRTSGFWKKLADFCGLERIDGEALLASGRTRNVRSKAKGVWAISDLDPASQAKALVDKWVNLTWPDQFKPDAQKLVKKKAVEWLETRYRRTAAITSSGRRETEIRLNPKVMQLIRLNFGPCNENLAKKLGRDLTPLGY